MTDPLHARPDELSDDLDRLLTPEGRARLEAAERAYDERIVLGVGHDFPILTPEEVQRALDSLTDARKLWSPRHARLCISEHGLARGAGAYLCASACELIWAIADNAIRPLGRLTDRLDDRLQATASRALDVGERITGEAKAR